MNLLEAMSWRLNRCVEGCLAVMGLGMAFLVAAQVFFRYTLNQSLFWSEELARYLLVWLTFMGASSAYRRGMHPGVDILYAWMRPGFRKAAVIIAHGASMLLFGVMIVFGCRFAYFVRLQISPALFLPKWTLFAVIPLSGAILMVHALARLSGDVETRASE